MSRTNPYKRKRRKANRTVLIFGEGMNEEVFLKYLRGLFNGNNIKITIKKGRGGNARDVVNDASRVPGDFDKRMVVLDNDRGDKEIEKAREIAAVRGIEMIENIPCFEYLLLSILKCEKIPRFSHKCKKVFESEYIDEKKRGDIRFYKIFSKKMLNIKRLELVDLNRMISVMEGED